MSIGTSIGRGIGYIGAVSVHAACVSATATGKFGSDLGNGIVDGYDEHSARLKAIRLAAPVVRHAAIAVKQQKAKA